MLVTFTYRADDSAPQQQNAPDASNIISKKSKNDDEIKSFSFWTMLRLGTVQSRIESTSIKPK